ncbi:MAG TPA: UbiA family prenyltransferase [Anaeromyxobacteraceae bacterium]
MRADRDPALVPRAEGAGSSSRAALAARLLRAHQWVKNLLVFVPVVAAHRLERDLLARAGVAFLAFCLCASSAYVVNDVLDLEADRATPAKARRPLAAGEVTVRTGLLFSAAALIAGCGLAAVLSPAFLALLGTYWAATLAYSLRLKRVPMLDVIVLASLYTVRVLGGTFATGVPTSTWLFTFAMFLFLSLALVKRTSELHHVRLRAAASATGRGYGAADLEVLSHLGSASGYLAILVLAMYISNPDVTRLYSHHERLWLLCPLGLYWVGRLWLLANRGLVHEDPVVFALRDRPSYVVACLGLAVVYAAV